MSSADLPKFDNPPVVEVALSISFEPLPGYRSAHAGRLWERLRTQFQSTDDQPELPTAIEGPGGPAPPARLEMMERPRIRTWLQSDDGTQLLQVQHNRVAYNWKRGEVSQPYPSYEAVERRFLELLPVVTGFFTEERLGQVLPNQAEVTYVNHIREPHDRASDVVVLWRRTGSAFLPPAEDVRLGIRYPLADKTRQMTGRLIVNMQPAYMASTHEEIIRLDLTARGKPRSRDIDGAVAFLRLGHEWIVQGFAEMTTEDMQRKWKRTQ
jgi:uncharacterized protein (TIGR04255 family)